MNFHKTVRQPSASPVRAYDRLGAARNAGRASEGTPAPMRDLDLNGVFGLLRRQLRLLFLTAFAVGGLATLVLVQLTPLYDSTALVLVDPRQSNMLDLQGEFSAQPTDIARVETEVEILRSPAILLAVIQDLKLYDDPEFFSEDRWSDRVRRLVDLEVPRATSEERLKKTLQKFQRVVRISRSGMTYLVEVSVRSRDPEKAANIANAIADSYVLAQITAKAQVVADVQRVLESRLEKAGTTMRAAETSVDDFVESSIARIADSTTQTDIVALRDKMRAARTESGRLQAIIEESNVRLRDADWDSLITELDSQALQELNQRRRQLADAISNNDGAPLRAQLAEVERQIATEAQNAIHQTQARLDSLLASERKLRDDLRQRISSSDLPADVLLGLFELQQAADASRGIYQTLLTRSQALDTQSDLQLPDSRVVSRALPAPTPSFPRLKLAFALAGFGAVALGLALAFLREHYVGGFVDEEQVEAVLGVPCLASVPRIRQPSQEGPLAETVARPMSPYSEAIRRMRLSIDVGAPLAGVTDAGTSQTILITSAQPGEGKTQTAVSLARSYALAGRRVLLVDGDLRRPRIAQAVGAKVGLGLGDFLHAKEAHLQFVDLCNKDPLTDLIFIGGSPALIHDTPSLFDNGKMEQLLTVARESFDIVVLDTSPVLPVVDARLLTRFASTVVLVVHWARTSQREARTAITDLSRGDLNGISVATVLNGVGQSTTPYAYSDYYGST